MTSTKMTTVYAESGGPYSHEPLNNRDRRDCRHIRVLVCICGVLTDTLLHCVSPVEQRPKAMK
jgi:hypothetical protein